MNIVGIDPSLSATGVADKWGELYVLKMKPAYGDYRLHLIRQQVSELLYEAELVVMEDLPRNAMAAGVTGMVQGVIREYLQAKQIPYLLVTPATLKKFATGKGNAKKPDMRRAWLEWSGDDVADDNKVDAAWLRTIGLYFATGYDYKVVPPYWPEAVAKLLPQWEAVKLKFPSSISA